MSAQESKSEAAGFRLSPQQEWLLGVDYRPVVQCAAVLTGPVPHADLRAGLEAVTARHEILRTTFAQQAGMRGLSQTIHESLAAGWTSDPGGAESDAGDPRMVSSLMAAEAARGFDLERGPLIRALLLSSAQERSVLVLTAHPGIVDVASLLLVLDELVRTYRAGGDPDDPVQYADYAEWRHELITGEDEEAADARAFWRQDADGRPAAERVLFATPGAPPGDLSAVAIPFEADEVVRLREAAVTAGVKVGVFLEACWHALLARLTGASELVVAGWCGGRVQPDLERAVGPYAQPVPIHTRFESETSFAEVLDQVARGRAEAASRQDLAAAADLGALCREATAGFAHLDVEGMPDPLLEIAAINPGSAIKLLLVSRSDGERMSAELWHDGAAHGDEDSAELAKRFRTLVASAVGDPAQALAGLALTDAAERERSVAAAVGPAPEEDAAIPVHHLFERRAHSAPERPAVADAEGELSYGELNAAANRLAHLLRAAGVNRGVTVGLCMERTQRLLEALLAILKAGGAYVALNYEHPPARLAHQLSESGARVLVTERHLLERLPEFFGEIVCTDSDSERIASFPGEDPEQVSLPEDLVYVMYTSGSTGLPKGVAVTHGNLANYATHMARRLHGASEEKVGLRFGVVSAISTDLGNTSIFPALVSGGCVQMLSAGASMDGAAMALELGDTALDVLKVTPSHLGALLAGEHAGAVLPRRWLVIGGEALSWGLVERIRALSPSCQIVNHYGPTETTIGCCAYDVAAALTDSATVPIGRPLAGVRAYVLDRSLEILPAGVPGELCIGGRGVAAGYVGMDQGSDGPFVADRFATDGAARMYRTGDRGRYLRSGAIEFLGRLDDQVKLRGFRIEPGEIESVLVRHASIRQAAVAVEEGEGGERRLVAYVVTSGEPTVEELQAFVSASLPDYMVPSRFATLEALPFTPSGKIDRKALAGVVAVQTRREAKFVAPRDELERTIAAIWSELLGIERVGVFDDFFALGGHSLLATQAIIRIRRIHGDIPLRALLAAPTVATLAEVVRSTGGANIADGDGH